MAKRKIKKNIKRSFFFFVFVFIICIFYFKFYKKPNIENKPTNNNNVPKEVWPKVYTANIVATGDALLHNPLLFDSYNNDTKTFDFSKSIRLIKDYIKDYDLAYYNQETLFGGPLSSRFPKSAQSPVAGYSTYPYFNSPSEFGDAMVDAGFNIVSLASNHSGDCTYASKTCIDNSYKYWATKNVVFDGFNDNENEENFYNIGEVNNIKYAFFNYTNYLNGHDSSIKSYPYLIDVYNEEKVKKEIEAVRDSVDVVIVAMHWHKSSAEYALKPTEANKNIANYLASLGVDIILGTYSHCLQPFDIIEQNNHKTFVFYSLGNVLSNQGDLGQKYYYGGVSKGIIGVLASLNITKTVNEDNSTIITIDNPEAEMLYTYNKNHKDYLVVPFSQMNETYNSNYKNIYETYKSVLLSLNDTLNVHPIN